MNCAEYQMSGLISRTSEYQGEYKLMTATSNSHPPADPGVLLIVGAGEASERFAEQITSRGYQVERACGSREAVSRVSSGKVNVILFDLASGQATLDLADTLMGLPSCPPIVILDRDPTVDRVIKALRIGVADYLLLNDDDIVDRLTAQLSKAQTAAMTHYDDSASSHKLLSGSAKGLAGLELHAARRMLIVEDVPTLLSSIELSLIELLIQRAPNPVTYEEMARAAFPTTSDVEHALRLLRPHIARLRRKFESVHNARWRIANFRRQGYALQPIDTLAAVNPPPHVKEANEANES